MSYAEMAAKGPKQTDEEKMPDAIPEIAHSDSGVHSIDSLSDTHVQSLPSSFADQQLEAERAEERAKDAAAETATKARKDAKQFGDQAEKSAKNLKEDAKQKSGEVQKEAGKQYDQAEKSAKNLKEDAKQKYGEVEKEASKQYDQFEKSAKKLNEDAKEKFGEFKKDAKVEYKKGKEQAQRGEEWAERNKDNPVVIGNGVALVGLAGLLSYGAYRKHVAGELTWKLAGAWAGVVGLFAVGDYFVSQFFFKKYPPK